MGQCLPLRDSQAGFFTASVFLRVSNPLKHKYTCKSNCCPRSVFKKSATEQHMQSSFPFAPNYCSVLCASASPSVVFRSLSEEPYENITSKTVKNDQCQVSWRPQIGKLLSPKFLYPFISGNWCVLEIWGKHLCVCLAGGTGFLCVHRPLLTALRPLLCGIPAFFPVVSVIREAQRL